jgi:hypothetical protein
MSSISWEDSGKGERELTLADAQKLAVEAGFVFYEDSAIPFNKNANLQSKRAGCFIAPNGLVLHQIDIARIKLAHSLSSIVALLMNDAEMFDHFGVNSLSSFKIKFAAYKLDPRGTPALAFGRASHACWKATENRHPQSTAAATERFIGQFHGSKRHGQGILLTRGNTAPIVYIGCFHEGLRSGYGVIFTPRGETFHGFFKDDLMWGPGAYTFPTLTGNKPFSFQNSTENPPSRRRVRFDGMFNGKPFGLGMLTWDDGARDYGEFRGYELVRAVDSQECEGVLLVTQQNAEMAKRVLAEIVDELQRQGLWLDQGEVLLAEGRGKSDWMSS